MGRELKRVKVTIMKNGPLRISGDFVFSDPDGNTVPEGQDLFLCRCGHSRKKPFCDGTHRKTGVKN